MTAITTPFAGGETTAVVQARLTAIANFWAGNTTALSGVTNWGGVRGVLNGFANTANQISNGEVGSSFITKLNWLNENDNFVASRLFGAGEAGFFGDVTTSRLWQDTARTTPVAAAGQSVASWALTTASGLIYATQATAASRPTYQVDGNGRGFLLFDGVDDSLSTSAINFSGTDKVTAIAAVRKLSDAARGMVLELATGASASFRIEAPPGASATYAFGSLGTTVALATSPASFASPDTAVLTGLGDIAGDVAILRRNGTQVASSVVDQGTGNYGNASVFIGRRGGSSLPFNGRVYGLLVRGAATSGGLLTSAEGWANATALAY